MMKPDNALEIAYHFFFFFFFFFFLSINSIKNNTLHSTPQDMNISSFTLLSLSLHSASLHLSSFMLTQLCTLNIAGIIS